MKSDYNKGEYWKPCRVAEVGVEHDESVFLKGRFWHPDNRGRDWPALRIDRDNEPPEFWLVDDDGTERRLDDDEFLDGPVRRAIERHHKSVRQSSYGALEDINQKIGANGLMATLKSLFL